MAFIAPKHEGAKRPRVEGNKCMVSRLRETSIFQGCPYRGVPLSLVVILHNKCKLASNPGSLSGLEANMAWGQGYSMTYVFFFKSQFIMTRTRKHNSVILRAQLQEHSITAQFLSIMCQGLLPNLFQCPLHITLKTGECMAWGQGYSMTYVFFFRCIYVAILIQEFFKSFVYTVLCS